MQTKQTTECFLKKMPLCDIKNLERKWNSLGTLGAAVKKIENVGRGLILYYISRGTMGSSFPAEPPWSICSKMAKPTIEQGDRFTSSRAKMKAVFGDRSPRRYNLLWASVFSCHPSQCCRIVRLSSVPLSLHWRALNCSKYLLSKLMQEMSILTQWFITKPCT